MGEGTRPTSHPSHYVNTNRARPGDATPRGLQEKGTSNKTQKFSLRRASLNLGFVIHGDWRKQQGEERTAAVEKRHVFYCVQPRDVGRLISPMHAPARPQLTL